MPRMIELIRKSQVPSYLMHAAVRGALSVPPEETVEILVHLALHNRVFGEQARLTLAGWDEKVMLAVAADAKTSAEVLGYLVSAKNLRPVLLPDLLENPAVTQGQVIELAASTSREILEVLLRSPRVKNSPVILKALRENPVLRQNEAGDINRLLESPGRPLVEKEKTSDTAPEAVAGLKAEAAAPATGGPESEDEAMLAQALEHYLKENAAEVAAEGDKPFEVVRVAQLETSGEPELAAPETAAETKESGAHEAPVAAQAAKAKKPAPDKEERRDSTLQKIAKLDVKGRIALAVRGSKEERSILIRDGTKLVALAVLESPKVSDTEVEGFAQQKNVLEAVLRSIPLKRRFAKNYAITRNLVYNPRTPLDLSLGLMKNLLIHDLKNLSGNKEVSETIRKLALRMYKQKSEKKKQ